MGALLYVQQHFIEPLKIGDIESDEYKRRVQAMFDRIASCDEFRKSQGFSGKITPEPPEVYLSAQNDNPEVSVDFSLERVSAQNVPQCPICGSTNLSKITVGRKAVKIGVLGVFGMGDAGKTWRCNNCGSKF